MKTSKSSLLTATVVLGLLLTRLAGETTLDARYPENASLETGLETHSPQMALRAKHLSTISNSDSEGASVSPAKRVQLHTTMDQLPLTFIENEGQLDEQVAYYVHGRHKTIY